MISTEAIVIRTVDYKDNDKLVIYFTKEFGKVTVYVKGAKSHKSKYFHVTQLYNKSMIELGDYNSKKLIKGAQFLQRLFLPSYDLDVLKYISYLISSIDKLTIDLVEDVVLYNFILGLFDDIDSLKSYESLKAFYLYKLLEILGYKQSPDLCIKCGSISHDLYFSDGFVCKKCKPNGEFVGKDIIAVMKYYDRCSAIEARGLKIKSDSFHKYYNSLVGFIEKLKQDNNIRR